MAWTTPSDHPASVVSVAEWNAFHGTAGNCAHLKNLADAPMKVQSGGADVGTRQKINIVQGANVTATVVDDPGNNRVNITLASAGGTLPTQYVAGNSVSMSCTVNVPTAWQQIVASLAFHAIHVLAGFSSQYTGIAEIGVGSAGSEVVKASMLVRDAMTYSFPFSIASGNRVAWRFTMTGGQTTMHGSVTLLG